MPESSSEFRPSLFDDGFDTTVVRDCGCTLRVRQRDSVFPLPVWNVGDWLSCPVHSAAVGFDQATGDPILNRDKRVIEVRYEA